jgi:hypothetical protein
MTSKEFVLWLQGFTQGVHEYNISPKQWDALKDTLAKVKDEQPIGVGGMGVPNTQPFPRWQEPHLVNVPNLLVPNNPFTINCNTGSLGTATLGTITTTGDSSITYATPQFRTFTTSGTAAGYPSGSTISYTTTHNHD